MMNQHSNTAELLNIAKAINEQIDKYYRITLQLSNLLQEPENDETVPKIEELLAERESLQVGVDEAAKKYRVLKADLLGNLHAKDIAGLEEDRKELLTKTSELNKRIESRLTKLLQTYQAGMNKINNGKILHNAYDGAHSSAWGVFVDKKK